MFVYALGGEHDHREPCRRIVRLAGEQWLSGEASVDLVQEVLHQRHRRTGDRRLAAAQARQVVALCTLQEVRAEDVDRAVRLFADSQRLSARNCVFSALALNRGIEAILSPDRDFDDLEGLDRIDPADAAGVDSLLVA